MYTELLDTQKWFFTWKQSFFFFSFCDAVTKLSQFSLYVVDSIADRDEEKNEVLLIGLQQFTNTPLHEIQQMERLLNQDSHSIHWFWNV